MKGFSSRLSRLLGDSQALSGRVQTSEVSDKMSLPNDVWDPIQSFLGPDELKVISLVSKNNDSLVHKSSLSQKLLMTQAAKDLAQLIEDPDEQDCALSRIAVVEAMHDLKGAKSTVQLIIDNYWKAIALIEIAKMDSICDLREARAAAAFIQDAELARNIQLKMVKATAMKSLEEAMLMVQEIENPVWKARALFAIAEIDPEHDLRAARAALEQLDPAQQDEERIQLVKITAMHDLQVATQEAESVANPFLQAKAFIEVAKVDPARHLARAKAAIRDLEYIDERDRAVVEIVKIQAVHDLEAAKITMEHVEDAAQQDEAWLVIIKEVAAHDVEAAKNMIDLMEDPVLQDRARVEVVKAELGNIKTAKATAQLIRDPVFKVEALLVILRSIR